MAISGAEGEGGRRAAGGGSAVAERTEQRAARGEVVQCEWERARECEGRQEQQGTRTLRLRLRIRSFKGPALAEQWSPRSEQCSEQSVRLDSGQRRRQGVGHMPHVIIRRQSVGGRMNEEARRSARRMKSWRNQMPHQPEMTSKSPEDRASNAIAAAANGQWIGRSAWLAWLLSAADVWWERRGRNACVFDRKPTSPPASL